MARIEASMYPPSGSLIMSTPEETTVIRERAATWLRAHIQLGTFGISGRPLPLPLELWIHKGDGAAEAAIYEIDKAAPVGFPRAELEDLAQQVLELLDLDAEPARWVVIWPNGRERLDFVLT